jgi:hypothetical protein
MISAYISPAYAAQGIGTPGSAAIASTNDLALIAVLAFLVLVVQKEALGGRPRRREGDLGRGLNIGIIPLGLAFAVIVGVRVAQMFG